MRYAVRNFAEELNSKLDPFEGKPGKQGWLNEEADPDLKMMERLHRHISLLHDELEAVQGDETASYEGIRGHLLDAGNYCMMLYDRCTIRTGDGNYDEDRA